MISADNSVTEKIVYGREVCNYSFLSILQVKAKLVLLIFSISLGRNDKLFHHFLDFVLYRFKKLRIEDAGIEPL